MGSPGRIAYKVDTYFSLFFFHLNPPQDSYREIDDGNTISQ
jgi:hypothetical protein